MMKNKIKDLIKLIDTVKHSDKKNESLIIGMRDSEIIFNEGIVNISLDLAFLIVIFDGGQANIKVKEIVSFAYKSYEKGRIGITIKGDNWEDE